MQTSIQQKNKTHKNAFSELELFAKKLMKSRNRDSKGYNDDSLLVFDATAQNKQPTEVWAQAPRPFHLPSKSVRHFLAPRKPVSAGNTPSLPTFCTQFTAASRTRVVEKLELETSVVPPDMVQAERKSGLVRKFRSRLSSFIHPAKRI